MARKFFSAVDLETGDDLQKMRIRSTGIAFMKVATRELTPFYKNEKPKQVWYIKAALRTSKMEEVIIASNLDGPDEAWAWIKKNFG